MNKLIGLFTLLISIQSLAELSNDKCSRVLTHSGDIQIHRDYDVASRTCFISMHAMDITDLKYRDYYFDNTGMFLVFNSYGEGPDSTMTGTRLFYLLPISQDYPDYSIEPNGDVLIQTVSGHQFMFDAKKFRLKALIAGKLTEKTLSPNNNGGIEIKPTTGFWLDVGFKLGGMAVSNKKGSSLVTGAKSGKCNLKNTDIFNYQVGDNNTPLLYQDTQLEQFLKNKCNISF